MSVLQHFYDSQQQRTETIKDVNTNTCSSTVQRTIPWTSSSNTARPLKSCWDETTTEESVTNQPKDVGLAPINSKAVIETMTEVTTGSQSKMFIIGLILGILVAGTALTVIVVLWRTSLMVTTSPAINTTVTSTTTTTSVSSTSTTTSTSSTSTTTSTFSTSTSTSSATTSSTSTTTSSSSSSTSTSSGTTSSTSATTSTSSASTSTSSTSTSTTSTTTTAPPSVLCVTTSDQYLRNNSFLYSPTSQTYAAGMLDNQFGIYVANGYGYVTSRTIWTAQQSSTSIPCYLALQADRNLVVYAESGRGVLWTPHTENNYTGYPFCMEMLDTGNLIWIDNTASILWQSNSSVQTG